MDRLLLVFLFNLPEAAVLIFNGLSFFHLPILRQWKQLLIASVTLAFWVFVLDSFGVDYYLKISLFILFLIFLFWIVLGYSIKTAILMGITSASLMVIFELVISSVYARIGIDMGQFSSFSPTRIFYSWIYLVSLLSVGIFIRTINWNLGDLLHTKGRHYDHYLGLIIVFVFLTLGLLLLLNASSIVTNIPSYEIAKETEDLPVYQFLALVFSGCTTFFVWKYIKAKIAHVEKETEAPYLDYLNDLALNTSKIRHDAHNQYTAIKNLISLGTKEEALQYINSLIDQAEEIAQGFQDVHSKPLAALLMGKKSECASKSIEFEFHLSPNAGQLLGWKDIDMVTVFSNLLDNAIRATIEVEHPKIIIKWGVEGNEEVVSIENTGPTIQAEDFQHLFELGFTRYGGQGVGLPVVHATVKKYYGTIKVYSQEGITRFTVTVPVIKRLL
ncbi:sensor histidine kinase [Brevibacillus porteri]|nr:ATP-binding protein [Brevibacillus porteri]MED1800275.1 ATP-binding protein [Brevibacillus porteri]MED2130783.1 ATP-binding protein [Brevibacillus porteri]MED2744956.1 ATP-binding protein [Brevibacillus porteri]MED2815950.1 ATP-binding protein [Brevibacillus porteri]MED2895003.1 ATP-binding protein [Brevibacillus porteri]